MATCDAADVQFDDEAFSLRGHEQVMGMWRMLCDTTRARALADWKLACSGVEADARTGKAHWEADYRFSFWTWSRQALGARGLLLGWPLFCGKKSGQRLLPI